MTGEEQRTRPRLLLIDDNEEFCEDIKSLLGGQYALECERTGSAGLARLCDGGFDVVLLDLHLSDSESGLDVLLEIRKSLIPPPIIMLTGERAIRYAVEAVRRGAFDYLVKPPDLAALQHVIERAMTDQVQMRRLQALERDIGEIKGDIIAEDPASIHVLRQIAEAAPTEETIFITGDSGTGKELVARRIHQLSSRNGGPFIAVNCAGLPENLIESELFGHEKGAFTGADRQKLGQFELAGGGTLFLDEIGRSPHAVQVRLLRALQSRTFQRVGGETNLNADIRLVAATNRDVEKQLRVGELLEDLFYRLNVYPIHLLPLRERPADILPIAHHYVRKCSVEMGKCIREISPAAQAVLLDRPWRGNVRELENAIRGAVIRCQGDVLDLPHLALEGRHHARLALPYDEAKEKTMITFKSDYILQRLREAQGNVSLAAERSGLSRSSFQRMMKECGIDSATFRMPGDHEI